MSENVFVHAFTDGRDCDPHSGKGFIEELLAHMKITTGKLASVIGRYYAMDRDKRWERVKLAYDLLVKGIGEPTHDTVSYTHLDVYKRQIMGARTKPLQVQEPTSTEVKVEGVSYDSVPPRAAVKMVSPDNLDELVRLLHEEAKVCLLYTSRCV